MKSHHSRDISILIFIKHYFWCRGDRLDIIGLLIAFLKTLSVGIMIRETFQAITTIFFGRKTSIVSLQRTQC